MFLYLDSKSVIDMNSSLQQLHHMDSTVAIILCGVSIGISTLFIYCYFGKIATESFEKMADSLYDLNWQELPNDLQKYLVLMIADMQKPIYYYGFGYVRLDLRTFILVRRIQS